MAKNKYFAEGSKEEEERKRLSLIEENYDPATIKQLEKLGVSEGWKCLEVGAGGGSIARWLQKQVGTSGKVVATDIDTRFLKHLDSPNLEVREHNILTDQLESETFDLAHARWVLVHLNAPEKALQKMADALRPGGWLFIEDPDGCSLYSLDIGDPALKTYVKAMQSLAEMWKKQGLVDHYFGRKERSLLERLGFTDIGCMGFTRLYKGGEPLALAHIMASVHIKPMAISAGIVTERQWDEMTEQMMDPSHTYIDSTIFGAWGRKP